MNYAIIAATLSGNKGAASMLEASVQAISKQDKQARFSVFTIYPEQDKRFNHYKNVQLLNAKPLYLALTINTLAFLYMVLPPLRRMLRKNKEINALAEAHILLDQGGITFVDGRAKFLIYNVATLLPALFMGIPVVKCSQAMGPFTSINKKVAKFVLPKMQAIFSRGPITHSYLENLKLRNVTQSTDLAFLLEIEDPEIAEANALLKRNKVSVTNKTVVLMPSEVVRKKVEATGQDYIDYNRKFIVFLAGQGYQVLLLAYSAREATDKRHNNDLPVCRDIARGLDRVTFIDQEISAQQLRFIISKSAVVVTSRFHAMIAALSVGVPPLVIGWSHKYEEIMGMFDLESATLGTDKLDQQELHNTFKLFMKNRTQNAKKISKGIPKAKANAAKQITAIIDVVD